MSARDDPREGWPAGFTLYRNPDGCDWTISLPAEFERGCLDDAITEALCLDEALLVALRARDPLIAWRDHARETA